MHNIQQKIIYYLSIFLVTTIIYYVTGYGADIVQVTKKYNSLQQQLTTTKLTTIMQDATAIPILIMQLHQILQQHSNDSNGWYLLGKLCLVNHDITNAYYAWQQAYVLQPDNILYKNSYLQAKALL